MKRDKEELIEVIHNNINKVSNHANWIEDIKAELSKYRITGGRVENVLSDVELLNDDLRELALFTEQLYLKTGDQSLNPDNWFTKFEMKEARQFDYMIENNLESIDLPLTIEDFTFVNHGVYVGTLDIQTIAKLVKSQLLNYNPDIQRQPTKIKRKNQIITVPTTNKKNIREMKDLLLKGELVHTTLAFNAATRTSDTGEELTFNHETKTLTINKGTRLDILDGYHRCMASFQACQIDPEIDFKFIVTITNYTTKQAQKYQAQLAKATPIHKARIQELEANRLSDEVVQQLKSESELKGRISSSKGQMSRTKGDLVGYSVLSDAIDREFKMKVKMDTYEVAEYLTKYFEYLFGYYPDEFSIDSKTDSLISYNKMFAGHIALAAKMKEKNIKMSELKNILDGIDFNRDNKLWQDLGVINNNKLADANEMKIANYFRDLIK